MSDWIGSAVYQLSTGFVMVDAAMAQALGYSAEDMVGHASAEFESEPDDDRLRQARDLLQDGRLLRVTTCVRHGLSHARLWITVEAAVLSTLQPDLVFVRLLAVGTHGVDAVEILPEQVEREHRLLEVRADLSIALVQQVAELRQALRREQLSRRAVQHSAQVMLAEELTAETLEEEVVEWRERLTRLITLLATAGSEIDDELTGETASTAGRSSGKW
jgi:hypothetical protein